MSAHDMSVSCSEENEKAYDLGILFIHGIGHQGAGETLVQFGDPLVRWIRDWFFWARRSEAAELVDKKKTTLTPEERAKLNERWIKVSRATVKCEEGAPAHADVELGIFPDSAKQHWLFAESCWANAFVAPTFTSLAFWGLVVYPWTNASHYGAQIRRLWQSTLAPRHRRLVKMLAIAKAAVVTAVCFVGSVVVSIVVLAVLLLLLVLAIPPIPSLRSMLLRFQQSLADSLGDSFILAASPIQKAAIVSHVRRDLEWLMKTRRCRKIAIIAHSQGAAVAFETLATGVMKGRASGDTLLVTFGSGLGKLREVERAITSDKANLGWMPILGLALIVASLEFFDLIDLVPFVEPSLVLGLWGALGGLMFWIAGLFYSAWGDSLKAEEFQPIKKFGAEVLWRDYYASNDPVSNGPLLLEPDPEFLKSAEVHNRAAVWSDHTTYWLNRDEFVPCIVGELGSFSGLPLLDVRTGDKERVARAARRRAWRVRWLAGVRLAAWLMTGVIIFMRLRDLPTWGAAALKLPAVGNIIGWIGGEALRDGKFVGDPVAQHIAGVTLVVAVMAAGYHLLYLTWQWWTWRDMRAFVRRERYGAEGLYWMFVLASLALANVGLLIGLAWPGESAPTGIREEMRWVQYLLMSGLAGGLAVVVVFIVRLLKRGKVAFAIIPEGAAAATDRAATETMMRVAFSTFLEGVAAALITAPLMAVLLMAGLGGGVKKNWTVMLVMALLNALFLWKGGCLILPERQGWKAVSGTGQ